MKAKIFTMLMAVCMLFTACTENPALQDNPDAEEFPRIYDQLAVEDAVDKLLPIFSISYQGNWDIMNTDWLFSMVSGGVFKSMVENMYHADTGREFSHDTNGYTDINNYVEYGAKYFNIEKEDIYNALARRDYGYNPENETVFMSDGLGSVASLKAIKVEKDITDKYIVDYIVSVAESDYQFGRLSFIENKDGSFKFLSNRFTDKVYSPQYYNIIYPAIATSKDGKYELYYGFSVNLWNKDVKSVVLCEKDTGNKISLGFIDNDNISDAGFFSNGDIYTMDTVGLNVYKCELTTQEPYFTTKTNFRGGGVFGNNVDERYIYAIRRDPVKFDYIVVYSQAKESGEFLYEKPNDFQLGTNYKVGLLDKDGNLTHSWDTGVPVIHGLDTFEPVYLLKTGDNTIEFFVKRGDKELRRVRVDIFSGKVDIIKEYIPDIEQEKSELLAEKYVPRLYVTLGYEWDCNEEVAGMMYDSALKSLYRLYYNQKMPEVKLTENNFGIPAAPTVDTYSRTAAKFYGWSYDDMAAYFRKGNMYNKEADAVMHGDYGWIMEPIITSVAKIDGDIYKICYDLVTWDGELWYKNILTAKLVDGEYFQFLKNEINETKHN